MRYTSLLPLVATVSAYVIPDDVTARQLALDPDHAGDSATWWDDLPSFDELRHSFEDKLHSAIDTFDERFKSVSETLADLDLDLDLDIGIPDFLPASGLGDPVDDDGHNRHGHHDHHGHHGHHGHGGSSNLTVYQAIKCSKYSTKFAELVDEYPDIVKTLNSTAHNITVFVPTDKAFAKIPDHHEKPPKEFIEKVLEYHVVPGLYPARRVLMSSTLSTALKAEELGGRAQRLRVTVGLFGLKINFYSKVVVANIVCTTAPLPAAAEQPLTRPVSQFLKNGVVHGLDSILVPPPPASRLIKLFPSRFSTFELAVTKTGLHEELKEFLGKTTGGTLFAPTNWAFQKLGPAANAFLFNSEKGLGYLKALLKYHIVINETLYTDAYYGPGHDKDDEKKTAARSGNYHVDLPTLLDDKSLSIDVARWGGFVTMKINGFTRVSVPDVPAKDGVLQVVSSVLVPPHERSGHHDGEAMEVEDLMARLDPYLDEHAAFGEL